MDPILLIFTTIYKMIAVRIDLPLINAVIII